MVKYIVVEKDENIQCEHIHRTLTGAVRCMLDKQGWWIYPTIKKLVNAEIVDLTIDEKNKASDIEHRIVWGKISA